MNTYFHSVRLDEEKCMGCTNCIKRCPTQAIRVRSGKAHIISERCIDCGECIRVCPHHAKYSHRDSMNRIIEEESSPVFACASLRAIRAAVSMGELSGRTCGTRCGKQTLISRQTAGHAEDITGLGISYIPCS